MIKLTIDYHKYEYVAVPKHGIYVDNPLGWKKLKKTTVGCSILVKWGNNLESWIALKYLKESHPFETAEFSKDQSIDNEPDFLWWLPYTSKRPRGSALLVVSNFNTNLTAPEGQERYEGIEASMAE